MWRSLRQSHRRCRGIAPHRQTAHLNSADLLQQPTTQMTNTTTVFRLFLVSLLGLAIVACDAELGSEERFQNPFIGQQVSSSSDWDVHVSVPDDFNASFSLAQKKGHLAESAQKLTQINTKLSGMALQERNEQSLALIKTYSGPEHFAIRKSLAGSGLRSTLQQIQGSGESTIPASTVNVISSYTQTLIADGVLASPLVLRSLRVLEATWSEDQMQHAQSTIIQNTVEWEQEIGVWKRTQGFASEKSQAVAETEAGHESALRTVRSSLQELRSLSS